MAKDNDSFMKMVRAAGSGKRVPVISLVRQDPNLAAVISKLVSGVQKPIYDNYGNREPMSPNVGALKNIAQHTAQSITDSKTTMQIFPDMELSAQILISSILSPKDMMATDLSFWVTEGLISPDVTASMVTRTTSYFEQDYKIKPLLQKMLRAMLFEEGSYPVAVIPENTLDHIINGQNNITLESLSETITRDGSIVPIGLLGPSIKTAPTPVRNGTVMSLESFNDYQPDRNVDGRITFEGILSKSVSDHFVSVTDNYNLLKIPQINQKIREQRIVNAIGSKAMESIGGRNQFGQNFNPPKVKKLNDRDVTGLVYKERNFQYKPISALKTQEQLNRRTVGNPLILHLPAESIIPVYVPGCVEQQVGFFVLIDGDGNPLSTVDNADYYQQLSAQLNSNGSFTSAMLTRVKSMMSGFDVTNREHLDYSARAYGELVEQDLLARLRNGVYGNGVALAKKEEIYRIMLARTLQKQHTQLLFIPIELMTYFAFRYNSAGIGVSLLEGMKVLNSLRAMLLFANVMASLKNSIGRTEVKLKLDESDPSPQKTIEIAMHEIIRSRQHFFPLGINSPTDLVDWLQKSGFEFTFEGHPGIPDVSIDFGEKSTNFVKPDTELEENLRKRSIMSVGLSPATVDATFEAEFASSVVTNNILLAKRVLQIQEEFTPQLSAHMRKCMLNSEELINDLRDILMANYKKLNVEVLDNMEHHHHSFNAKKANDDDVSDETKQYVVNKFLHEYIMNFNVSLPKPNSVTLENQLTALETYTKVLDITLEAWISEKFFTADVGGEVANQVITVKEILKAYFIRQWMNENGVMPELSKLTNTGDDSKPELDVFKIQAAHMEGLTKSLTKLMVQVETSKAASNAIMDKLTVSGSSSNAAGGGGSSDDFGGGSSDLGSGDLSSGNIDQMGSEPPDLGGMPEGEETGDETGAGGESETETPTEMPNEPSPETGNETKEPEQQESQEEETPEDKKQREEEEALAKKKADEETQAKKETENKPPSV
jgi:hypothetical protein